MNNHNGKPTLCFIYPLSYHAPCDICGEEIDGADYFFHDCFGYRVVHLRCFTEKYFPKNSDEIYNMLIEQRRRAIEEIDGYRDEKRIKDYKHHYEAMKRKKHGA